MKLTSNDFSLSYDQKVFFVFSFFLFFVIHCPKLIPHDLIASFGAHNLSNPYIIDVHCDKKLRDTRQDADIAIMIFVSSEILLQSLFNQFIRGTATHHMPSKRSCCWLRNDSKVTQLPRNSKKTQDFNPR